MNIAVPTPCSAGLFYSQGTKERATSAENFLDWAVGKLRLTLDTTSASTKGEAIAAALADRRTLLVLHGVAAAAWARVADGPA